MINLLRRKSDIESRGVATAGLLVLALIFPLAFAENSVTSIRVASRMDLNSTLISGIDVVFFHDDSIVGDQPFTHFDWYSNKRQFRETHADVIDIVNLPILQGFDTATMPLPERHAEAVRVLVFAEHQNSRSAPADITDMTNVLIEIDQFGVIVSGE